MAPPMPRSRLADEFKAFIMRGNVIDLAVGIIIGAAFGALVNSLVNDVIMPPIGLALGGVDFSQSYLLLKAGTPAPPYASLDAAKAAGAVTLRYGVFVNGVISFLIVTSAVFMLVKTVAEMQREKAPPPPNQAACPMCLMLVPLGAKRCGHCTADIAGKV